MLPTIKIGNTDVTRLIVGGNPFSGNSHFSAEVDWKMRDYFTTARIKDTLSRCEENGINTMLLRGDMHIMRIIHEFRQEGSKMNWICMTGPEYWSYEGHISQVMQYHPAAIYHHGSVTDGLFKERKFDELKRRIQIIKDHGIPAGLGTHMPEVLEYAEEHDFGADFYMASVYNISLESNRVSSSISGKANEGERFEDEDIPIMYDMIRRTPKPCLAFKILGAARRCGSQESVRHAFNEAFENIKDTDGVVVGMYPVNEDQPTLDAMYTREAIQRAQPLNG